MLDEPVRQCLGSSHVSANGPRTMARAAMESFFSSLKTERIGKKTYRTRDAARADVFDYIERFYNTVRRHSTIGYLSPVEFERKAGLA
jgi:putative transposase